MKIAINDHRKIVAVQEEFNQLFPHLRLAFLSKPSNEGHAASKKIMKERSKTLGDCRIIHNKGELTLSHFMTVADLQQSLSDNFGLSVVVYVRSGNDWIETTGNGKLSMDDQDRLKATAP